MSSALAWFIFGMAFGQFSLVAAGLYLHHRRDRAEREWRGRFQTRPQANAFGLGQVLDEETTWTPGPGFRVAVKGKGTVQ